MFRLGFLFRRKFGLCLVLFLFFLILHYAGIFLYILQSDLDNINYFHPIIKPNLTNQVDFYHQKFQDFSNLDQLKEEANRIFEVKTLDNFNERFLIENQNKCVNKENNEYEQIRLLIVVKSAITNRRQRDLIRQSWANENRFSDVKIRTMFSIGSCEAISEKDRTELDIHKSSKNCQDLIDEENEQNSDVIQIDFIDNYYNNTIKTLNGIKWIVKNCPKTQFTLLIDDDYYLSVKNLLKYIRWLNYSNEEKEKITKQIQYMKSDYEKSLINNLRSMFDPFSEDLYSGWVFNFSVPCRYRFSKWFVDLDEYPFSKWPPYVTAGFVLLSNKSLKSIYFASLYTKTFRFDDIYLSILTRKSNIHPLHIPNVYFYKHEYRNLNGLEYKDTIGSHGFKDGNEMMQLWLSMKSKGYA